MLLHCYHLAGLGADFGLVSWVEKFAVPLVAGALFGVLAPISTSAEGSAFDFLHVVQNVRVQSVVLCDILAKGYFTV